MIHGYVTKDEREIRGLWWRNGELKIKLEFDMRLQPHAQANHASTLVNHNTKYMEEVNRMISYFQNSSFLLKHCHTSSKYRRLPMCLVNIEDYL